MHIHFCSPVTLLLISTVFMGCGPRQPSTYPVSGKVTFRDNSPLSTGGLVMFESIVEGGQTQTNASGVIAANGAYQLSTFKPGDGAVAGKYRVLVRAKRPSSRSDAFGRQPASPIHAKFESYETSGLTFTVEPGANEYNIVVYQ